MPNRMSKDYVPAADSANNVVMSDVVGNKTDTVAGDSLYAGVLRAELLSGTIVERATAALPQTAADTLFTATGVVQILGIRGEVTTQIGAVANATKLVANPTVGADVDLCAAVEINADVVGTLYSVTGTFVNPMIATTSGAFESQANPITVAAGTIDVNCAGSDGGGGEVKWTLLWRPVEAGAVVSAA